MTVRLWELRSADDFEKIFAALTRDRPDGLYVITAGPLIRANVKRIAGFALNNKFPSVYNGRDYVDAGGLMYDGADLVVATDASPLMWTKSSRGQNPAICLSSSRQSSSL